MIEEMDLPALFGRKGEWLGCDPATVETWPAERQRLYADVADAAQACEAVEAELKAAQDRVTACVVRVRDAEAVMPKRDFHSLWLETVKGCRAAQIEERS